ncbi:MAG: cytochrome P450 [Acidimicrobiales bacterium]
MTQDDLDEQLLHYFLPTDPSHQVLREDPYPLFDQIRSLNPIFRSGLGIWVITGYQPCLDILRDQRYSVDPRNAVGGLNAWSETIVESGTKRPVFELSEPILLFNDPPRHTRLRRLLARTFTPKAVYQHHEQVRDASRLLLDDLRTRHSFDFYADFSYPIPLGVISSILGVPVDRLEDFLRWSAMILGLAEPGNRQSPEYLDGADALATEALFYFEELVERRRHCPSEDLISHLIAAEEDDDPISHQELVTTCIMLHAAGQELTAGSLTSAMHLLAKHPDQAAALRSDPSLLPGAFEEVIRYEPPPRALVPRFALCDIDLEDGRRIAKGETVFAVVGAANRDPDRFPDPHTFDVTRKDNQHLGFGFGAHFCLGASLARLEAAAAFEVLLTEYPPLEVVEAEVAWRDSIVVRILEKLPVTWTSPQS